MTTKTMRRHDARIMALSALFCWEVGKFSPEEAFSGVARDFFDAPGAADKVTHYNYAGKLFLAAVNNVSEIDNAISRASQGWPISRMPRIDLSILRLALAEANYLKEVPLEVVIDEALELSKEFSTHASPRFVNGVLMGIFREMGYVPKSTK
ncbi:MAG TPA: transcription antitermination factor NusB [Firmicutes bacterium]|mgnify:CR=1 FL=1|nr:transcription antitermination factor NusB [Candidatus Fermentithermobacillaceae bacterium]